MSKKASKLLLICFFEINRWNEYRCKPFCNNKDTALALSCSIGSHVGRNSAESSAGVGHARDDYATGEHFCPVCGCPL